MKLPVGKGAFSVKYSRTWRLGAEAGAEEAESAFGMQMDVAL